MGLGGRGERAHVACKATRGGKQAARLDVGAGVGAREGPERTRALEAQLAAALVGIVVEVLGELVDDLARVEAEIAGIRGEHALCVTALGNAVEVTLFEGDEDLLLQAKHL